MYNNINLFIYSVIFFGILYFVIYYKRNITTIFKNVKHYKILKNSYINGVYFKESNNQLLLHGFSSLSNISITKCRIIYKKKSENCIVKFNKYTDRMDYNFFEVKIETHQNIKPDFVELNNLSIQIPEPIHSKYKFVICNSILINFTRANYLVQHFESLKYFGVSKVVSYYTSSTTDVLKVLEYYVREGLLELYKYDEEIEKAWYGRYYGEVAKENHCFHQYQEVSNYIIICDYDEILWPVKGNTYDDIFNNIPKYDVYYTDMRMFPTSPIAIDDKDDIAIPLKDLDMFKINTSCQTTNGFARKYVIANPKKVSCVEVHHIAVHSDITETWIDYNVAYLRHTRHMTKRMIKLCEVFGHFSKNKTITKIDEISSIVRKKISIKLLK